MMDRPITFIPRLKYVYIMRIEYRPKLDKWDAIVMDNNYYMPVMAIKANKKRFDTLFEAACFAYTMRSL